MASGWGLRLFLEHLHHSLHSNTWLRENDVMPDLMCQDGCKLEGVGRIKPARKSLGPNVHFVRINPTLGQLVS